MQCGLCKARRNAACACARAALLVKLLSVTEVNCRWKLTGLLVLCRLDLPALLTFLLVRAAPKLYPVRIKVENVIAKEEVWLTNAYLSSVRTEKGSSGAERSRQRRIAIIQRVLFLALRRLIRASHTGVGFVNAAGRKLLAFPRVLLYLCDQPEERAVLCLKPGQCAKPCSTCDVFLAFLSAPSALTAKQRSVLNSLHPQLEAAGHMLHGRERRRRLNAGARRQQLHAGSGCLGRSDHGTHSALQDDWLGHFACMPRSDFACWFLFCRRAMGVVPAYVAISDHLLFSVPPVALSELRATVQILDLGVTRMLVHRLVHTFPSLCEGYDPLCGSFVATYAAANRRLKFLARRCRASRAGPGYVLRIVTPVCAVVCFLLGGGSGIRACHVLRRSVFARKSMLTAPELYLAA